MADTTGFLKYGRELPPRRPVEVRIRDWKDVYVARENGEDAHWLRDVLVRYSAETESPVATALLADWGRWSAQFSVVMPRDYKRALDAQRMAEANGTDVDVAVMEAARG